VPGIPLDTSGTRSARAEDMAMWTNDSAASVLVVGVALTVWLGGPRLVGGQTTQPAGQWTLGVLPASVRIEPVTGRILESLPGKPEAVGHLWERNWVYDGKSARIAAARGQYVSFQIVIGRTGDAPLRDVVVELPPFKKDDRTLAVEPELFLEWCVQVTNRTSQYPKWSTGTGWYPDALIPLKCIQMDLARQYEMVQYPLQLPDFRNRIIGQRYMMIWVDQFVPVEREAAAPGVYKSQVRVRAAGAERTIPVELKVWDFTLPQENNLAAGYQMEGFLASSDDKIGLAVQQLCKKNRCILVDPNVRPKIEIKEDNTVAIDWTDYDAKAKKYLTGAAFTREYGYAGPSYGRPVEWFLMPFNVAGRWGNRAWPNIGGEDVEKQPDKRAVYIDAIRQVRQHVLKMVDRKKTNLCVYVNGLDESYFPEAWDRMVYYGKMFKEHFPEVYFRVDGAYTAEAMKVIHQGVNLWVCHTTTYDMDVVEANRKLGVRDIIYGPVLHEDPAKGNDMSGGNFFLDVELLSQRAPAWIVWKYDALTWLNWGLTYNWQAAWFNPEQWVTLFRYLGKGEFRESRFNGDGYGVYAPNVVSRVDVPCASIRLKALRDGAQEYEMIRLLSQLDGDRTRADRIVDRIVARPLGKASFGRFDVWDHDPARWDSARNELGEMLEKRVSG
jgi:hypothetical protein